MVVFAALILTEYVGASAKTEYTEKKIFIFVTWFADYIYDKGK